jgi:hypothetical protein
MAPTVNSGLVQPVMWARPLMSQFSKSTEKNASERAGWTTKDTTSDASET